MKICIDGRMLLNSGIGTIIQNFILNYSNDFSLTVIGDETHLSKYLKGKSNAVIIHSLTPIYTLKEQSMLYLNIPKCDIFWSPHFNIPLLPIKSRKRVVNINDVFHLAFSNQMSISQKLYSKIIINQAVRLSDKVVTISKFSENEIKKYITSGENKIEMIYCGIDHDLFKIIRDDIELSKIKSKYKLPFKYILYVGNVKPHKNLKGLINALLLIKNRVTDYQLVIVGKKDGFITGDPSLFEQIEKDRFLSERVHFTGYVPNEDLPYIYNLASLFVFPSIYEGFGLPPLEAMACGCPVIVSNVASMPEICEDAVRYFDPHRPSDIADKITNALSSDDSEVFVKRGIDRASFFSWKECYNAQINLFKNFLDD